MRGPREPESDWKAQAGAFRAISPLEMARDLVCEVCKKPWNTQVGTGLQEVDAEWEEDERQRGTKALSTASSADYPAFPLSRCPP